MLIEAAVVAFLGTGGIYATLKSFAIGWNKPEIPVAILPSIVIGDNATLVGELFRSDAGWMENPQRNVSRLTTEEWQHVTGVRVRITTRQDACGYGFESTMTKVSIRSDSGVFETADTSADDDKFIRTELDAFKSRKRDSKQRALTRALANRIVAQESGIHAVLGESSTGLDPETDNLDDERADDCIVSPGLLTYNESTKSLVVIGEKSDGMTLDSALKKRYGLGRSKGDYSALMDRIINEYN